MPTYNYPVIAVARGPAMRTDSTRTAVAFAPGHVTGLFAPRIDHRDPRGRGSVGAGLVLELGVEATATFRAGRPRRLVVTSEVDRPLPISTEVAHRLLGGRGGELHVHLSHRLPIGQGFGMSAAGALATALAVGDRLGIPRDRSVEVAHLADLFGGGGLGGVSAILGGGLEIRRRPGIPPFGRIAHQRFRSPVWVGVVGGPIPSPGLLRDPRALRRIEAASAALLPGEGRFGSAEFFDRSERFTDRVRMSAGPLRGTLRALRRRGARAFQAMFGQSFVAFAESAASRAAIAEWLGHHGIRAVEMHAAEEGAGGVEHGNGGRSGNDTGPRPPRSAVARLLERGSSPPRP